MHFSLFNPRRSLTSIGVIVGILLSSLSAFTWAELLPDQVPSALQPWHEWVQFQQDFRHCPLIYGGDGQTQDQFICAWPGELKLEANEQETRFSQTWQVDAASWIDLPGSARYWPQEVKVNNQVQPVLQHNGIPALYLQPGTHEINGRILWTERPQTLSIPLNTGLIALQVDGKTILPLQRDQTQLTLGRSTIATIEADSLEMQVYRKLSDDLPMMLETQFQLRVSGKAREITLSDVLPEHFIPTAILSDWPTRLDQDGKMLVQVQPGQITLQIFARANRTLDQFQTRLPSDGTQTTAQEVWSYEAAPNLRTTILMPQPDVENVALAVDPKASGVPGAWQRLPAFAMSEGSGLMVEERSRGLVTNDNQRLTLQREMWLDFSGKSFFARDRIEGLMQQGWRLDVTQPYTLERADSSRAYFAATQWANSSMPSQITSNSGGEALLVTQGEQAGSTGVEWRSSQVSLNAGVRIHSVAGNPLPIAGWQQTFDAVRTTLHLPYGYQLIAAPAVDSNNSWLNNWTMLHVFFAAFVSLLAWHFLGRVGGFAVAFYLFFAMHEGFAPQWTLASVLALGLIRRALPAGKLQLSFRIGEAVAMLALVIAAVIFIPKEIRMALYPQLESSLSGESTSLHFADEILALPVSETTANLDFVEEKKAIKKEGSFFLSGSSRRPSDVAKNQRIKQRYNQSTITQTGSGEPAWQMGRTYSLAWTGPVMADQTVQLWLSPPWLTRTLRTVMALLLGFVLVRCGQQLLPPRKSDSSTTETMTETPTTKEALVNPSILSVGLCLLLAGFFQMNPAQAQQTAFPPESLLRTLQERLNQLPRCAPDCVNLANATLEAQNDRLRISFEAHAGRLASLPLPNTENLSLVQVEVDHRATDQIRNEQDFPQIMLEAGVHQVTLEYAIHADAIALYFMLSPYQMHFSGEEWLVDGLDEGRLLNETLRLTRQVKSETGANTETPMAQQFPPYVRVLRRISFDLDWTVTTSVFRKAPQEGGFSVNIPLLAGEHVTTPNIKVQDHQAIAALGFNDNNMMWNSRLDKSASLSLTAPALSERSEVWVIDVGPSWHVTSSGVPVTLPNEGSESQVFYYYPLPGETLQLQITQPEVAQGAVRAIDQVVLSQEVGTRATQYTLEFNLRASQGGEHVITFPNQSFEILSVQRNQENLNLRVEQEQEQSQLTLPVSPGLQRYSLQLRTTQEINQLIHSPAFDLGLPLANIQLKIHLPEQRWLLATSGPAVGPAVLYWGELLVALVVAFFLAKVSMRPAHSTRSLNLRFHHWLLLVLGFSTFSWMTLLLIVVWLFALDWRTRAGGLTQWPEWQFNLLQVVLAGFSVIALLSLIAVIPQGLLGSPNMGVTGYGSYGNSLAWFADRSGSALPTISAWTVPIWVYRIAMLAWALWLAQSLIRWLRVGLSAWMQHGYWRNAKEQSKKPATEKPPIEIELDLSELDR